MARFQPGQSGNPKGKPKGTKNRIRIDAKSLIEPHIPRLIEILKKAAEDGDVQAARILIDRVVPVVKSEDRPINLPELADPTLSTEERLDAGNIAIAKGRLSLHQGQTLSRMLESQARIVDLERVQAVIDLVRRGWDVQRAIAEVDQRGVSALDTELRAEAH
jgi:hypothetical protein